MGGNRGITGTLSRRILLGGLVAVVALWQTKVVFATQDAAKGAYTSGVEITAHGPLGIPGSVNTVSATRRVYPEKNIVEKDGFLPELPERRSNTPH